ncbi:MULTISPECIES: LLM class flavin-dependent oxidoreductase [unclassified Nocardioides]|uniref:LLM class flavin-dependent oxidoreductase n=1 Tax=unclassified Nocardioides TaxID=2615069 RepID=UPI000702B711|nr:MULTISPECIES: LLM class flavin-dependent oxidoreductase [unclassified Nocardioides]KRC53352.1 F420-dependent oxidoreductase [Nocardioides sp. Root79]KRC70689.1 F420-dependent oxidoreductase [Nocardioides sp. Root240]
MAINLHVVLWPIHDWPTLRSHWQQAEEMGFVGGWVYDHLAWRGHTPWDEATTSLAAAAAVTDRIRLGTLVTSPNFRTPIPTAAALRTIDRISGGRLTVGIGAGGDSPQSDGEILGRTWTPRERADRFAEYVEQLDALLSDVGVSTAGEYWTAADAHIGAGLVQRPRPPFWIAAGGPRGVRLAARYGQGWVANPSSEAPYEEVRRQSALFEKACADIGRDVTGVPRLLLTGFTDEPWLESLDSFEDLAGRYAELGITDIAIHWPRPDSLWDRDPAVFEQIAAACQSQR